MTLSPTGTARERFARLRSQPVPADALSRLAASVDLSRYDVDAETVYVATELARSVTGASADDRRALALLLLTTTVGLRQGSTRLPLAGEPLRRLADGIAPGVGRELVERALAAVSDGRASALVGGPDDYRPLIVVDGHIYPQRVFAAEGHLVARLRARLDAPDLDLPPAAIDSALAAVKRTSAMKLSAEQLRAVRAALTRPFTVISGGPGTGKTAIIVSILRALTRLGVEVEAIGLAAPTGKAAQRMRSSIADSLRRIAQPELFDRQLLAACPAPRTLHRLLGYSPGRDRFHHHEHNRLAERVVVVDEGSMIDLTMMERLLAAVRGDARLILLGDADQLPSVDAGAVLRDLAPHAVRLTRSYRMDDSNPEGRAVLELARGINAGRVAALPPQARPRDVATFLDDWWDRHVACGDYARLADKVYRYDTTNGRFAPEDERDLAELFAHFERARILTVTRTGTDTGSLAINRRLHHRALSRASAELSPDFYPGEPVLVRENDYDRRLFNGDHGVIVRVSDRGEPHHFRAVFPSPAPAPGEQPASAFRVFHLEALRHQLELAFALTVHKSQGSELDHVALVLPERDVPLLTRELLYTAVTRARRGVTIVGDDELLARGAARTAIRFSGIADGLSSKV